MSLAVHQASSSSSSSSCKSSFDVKIWEELHLHSLNSTAGSSVDERESQSLTICENCMHDEAPAFGCSFSSIFPSGTKLSCFSDLPSLTNAGHIRPVTPSKTPNSSIVNADHQLPVVQVIQTGSMSFVTEHLRKRQVSKVQDRSMDDNLCRKLEHLSVTEHHQKSTTQSSTKDDPEHEPLYPKQQQRVEEDEAFAINGAPLEPDEEKQVVDTLSKAKFLRIASVDPYSAPVSPLKSASAVPFKWEEAPGKPKPCTDLAPFKPSPSLQLPPRLLHRPDVSPNCSSPSSRCQSKPPAFPLQWNCASPRSFDEPPKAVSPRNLWHSVLQSGRRSYREDGIKSRLNKLGYEDPWSPTSILIGPEAGTRDLSSSSSTSSGLDPHCPSPASPEVQSALNMIEVDSSRPPVVLPAEDNTILSRFQLPDLGPAVDESTKRSAFRKRAADGWRGLTRTCRLAGKWRSAISSERKRNHEENEMWAPTLATYFHSMELERASGGSGQCLLEVKCEDEHSDILLSPRDASIGNCPSAHASSTNYCRKQTIKEVEVVGSAPICGRDSILGGCLGLKRKKVARRIPRRWVLRKLRRSTRLLAAICRAVVRRSISHGKSKKRKLPYHQISW